MADTTRAKKAAKATKVAKAAKSGKAPAKAAVKTATAAKKTNAVAPVQTILFRDREMRVKFPKPEQIIVFQRMMRKLENANIVEWDGNRALSMLERTRAIIDTVLVDEADIDWIDDQLLAGELKLMDLFPIMVKTTQAFNTQPSATSERAAVTARRKKAA